MSDTQDVKSALKKMARRLSSDRNLLRVLDEIEKSLGCDFETEKAAPSPRARLPYSSDAPVCENIWS